MASSMLTAAAAEVSASASKEVDVVDETLKSALHACANDPDFAIICDFLQKFSNDLGLDLPNFKLLLQWLTRTDEVAPQLREMQIKLLRKTRKTVHEKSWETALSKFCFSYSAQDAWEVERFGYKNSSVKVKLRILKELLECQFERNTKFRAKILTLSADSLRSQPIGRDRLGHAYWVTQDNDCNIRIYQEHLDEEIWQVVATNRDEFVNLIKRLRGSEVVLPSTDIGIVDEDTSSSSSSRVDAQPVQKPPPPEEEVDEEDDDSQEDEQKVPKLSIKLVHGKSSKEDLGKGEEELAAEEDAKLQKKSNNPAEANDSGEEEFEEVEEEYEDESGSEGETEDEEEDDIEEDDKNSKKKDSEVERKVEKDPKAKEEDKKVKPLLISQNKVLSNESNTIVTTNTGKKRALDQVDANSPPRNEGQQVSALKKSRPSLLDSKRSTTSNKYDNNKEMGEEDYEEDSAEEDADVEEEIEEEDIDSVAAEEDENEEKLFEDYDDDDDEEEENEVGEEISDPVVRVAGEGSGKDCEVGNYLDFFDYDLNRDEEIVEDVSEEIVEDVFYVWGEGSGKECLVGNKNNDEENSTNTATAKNDDSELLKTNMETKTENELENSVTEKEIKTAVILSPKKTVPKDDVSADDTTKLAEALEDKKLNPEESSDKNPTKEIEKQEKPIEEKSQINGEDKSKESPSKTKTEEKQANPIETTNKLPESKDIPKQKEANLNTEAPLIDNQITSKVTTISKADAIKPDVISQQAHASKMSALESLKKELRESKQKILEKKSIASNESSAIKLASPAIYNRKRRLTDQLQTIPTRPPNSESEVDLNSENPEDLANDQELGLEDDDDMDVGGKRLKMRPKQTNTELRKKIEAQKVAANDETTSSSGGEEELRRRKKIILSKQTAAATVPATVKSEEKSIASESTKDNNSAANDNQSPTKICEKSSNATPTQQQTPIKKPTQITPTKVKPTLAEIIEKKLKKTPEKCENDTTATTAKSLFPSPNKSPITKPLKKNLLTQMRQEESDEDAVPRKRTNSQDLNSQIPSEVIKTMETTSEESKDIKAIVAKIEIEKPRTTPERQRKRRSSEETVQHDSPEEPEAKKEVTAVVKEKESAANRDKPTETIKEEEITTDSKDIEIKKEISTPVSGRRSGRRSGAAPTYVDNLQTKRNRGAGKTATKKELNDCDKVAVIKEEETPSKETKTTANNSKQDVKEKKVAEKVSTDKSKTSSAENVKEEIPTKTVQTPPTKAETAKQKTSPTTKTPAKGVRKQRDVDATNIIDVDSETPVRQSRRIAQQKIREEAERRKLEEIALRTMKQELKKKKKAEKQADPTVKPPTEPSSESEDSDVETKKKVQKKKCPGKNGNWSSGSEEQEEPDEEDEEPPHYETDPGSPLFKSDHEFSPESDIEDESQVVPMKRARTVRKEDAEDEPEEEEACQKCNKSDHPEWILLCDNCDKGYHCSCLSPVLFYIPEGDWYCPPCQQEQLIKALENQLKEFDDLVENKRKEEEEIKRLAEEEKARQEKEKEEESKKNNRKGRKTNAKRNKENSSAEDHSQEENEDEETSTNSDGSVDSTKKKQSNKNKNKNRSKNSDKRNHRDRRHNAIRSRRSRQQKRGSDSDSDSQNSNKSKSDSQSNSSSSSSTYSDSDNEPIYKLRKRRQINVSYRLNEYDDLINSALKKEMDEAAGAGNLGRGKDISTIIEADKEEKARQKQIDDGDEETVVKPKEEEGKTDEVEAKETKAENSIKTEPKETIKAEKKENDKDKEDEDDSDAEPIIRKFNIKPSQKKKSRKLTTLDISSEDDNASDEDFKGSSLDDEDEEDTSISASNSDSSLEIYKRHGKSKKKRRKAARRAFRERRKDRRFIVDESDDEDVQRPKSKKKRKDDSDYTESEGDDDDISELSENIDSADLCDDTTTDESDGNWRPNKRKKAKKSSTSFAQKTPKPKTSHVKKPKKVEYSDDDVSESEEDEDDDDDNDNVGSGKGMGKQPRSQPLKTTSSSTKTKGKGKEKPPPKTKKKKKSSEDDDVSQSDSEDSTRRTRGRRYAYIEDFDDDSSDGGIKPGVQRPDTPPEEREKFIKRQEEIKRMLAEKNAEGAKLVATPRLTPIKTDGEKDKRSPTKTAGGDSLSTVPLSVIRQAKVLDIDYLQRRGENLDDLADVGDVDDDFDDADLPDDLPEDMDEDAIARMVEEEEEFGGAAARDLPAPDEVLKTPAIVKPAKAKEVEKPLIPATVASPFSTSGPQATPAILPTPTASGLQEPVRKRLPMPTMHPPLLRHQYLMQESMSNTHHLMQRHGGPPPTSHLLQNALSAPLTQPLDRNYPPTTPSPSHHSLINRLVHNIPLQPTVAQALGTTRPPPQALAPPSTSILAKSASALLAQVAQDKSANPQPVAENKPRGRRKKITPLRDSLQKQQTAAAVTAATATNAALASATAKNSETIGTAAAAGNSPLPPTSVIKSGSPSKLPMQASVITSMPPTSHAAVTSRPGVNMPPISGAYVRAEGPRFYDLPGNRMPQVGGVPRHRGPPQMPPSLLPPHPANRSSYGPPPPLKGSSSQPPPNPTSSSNPAAAIRNPMHHVPPPYLGMPPNARHAPPPHLNMYSRPPMYGNPNFGPRINLRPPNMHAPEYSAGSRGYPPYGFYPPPPPLTTPPPGQRSGSGSAPRPPPSQIPPIPAALTQPPASVIVSATAAKPTNTPTATPQPTPPPTPEITEPSSSQSKPVPVAHDTSPIKTAPSKSASPTPVVAPQTEKSIIAAVPVAEPRKKLTTLQAYTTSTDKKSPVQATGDSSGSQSSPAPPTEVNDDSSTPGPSDNAPASEQTSAPDGGGQASEFSGLVSYFSSQHDDYNT